MRSSEVAKGRNGLADSGRRGSKSLKLRVTAAAAPGGGCPPGSPGQPNAVEAATTPQGQQQQQQAERGLAACSLLYSPQLWQASGHLHQRLSCDRSLYYPGVAVAAPMQKQLPEDSALEPAVGQGKRAKLASGQYRRSFREPAAGELTPPGTPYRPGGRPQQQPPPQQQQAAHASLSALDERLVSSGFASTSSSSSHEWGFVQRPSACPWEQEPAWPLAVAGKRPRSSRRPRSEWAQWPAPLRDALPSNQPCPSLVAAAAAAMAAGFASVPPPDAAAAAAAAGDAVVAVRAALQARAQQQQAAAAACSAQQTPAGGLLATLQQAAPADALLKQQQPLPQQQQQLAAADAPQPAAVAAAADGKPVVAAAGAAKAGAAAGDASPGHETSQSSDMTCMQDSPRAAAAAPLTSWPSSSTESDSQAQAPRDCPASLKAGIETAAGGAPAAAAKELPPFQPPISPLEAAVF